MAFKSLNSFPNTFLVLIVKLPTGSNNASSIIQINAQLDDCIAVLDSIYSDSVVPVWIKETERVTACDFRCNNFISFSQSQFSYMIYLMN